MKPLVTFLADFPNWAFHNVAKSISHRLASKFNFNIEYASRNPVFDSLKTDILYVFFWGEECYKGYGFKKHQIVKEVASWRWKHEAIYGNLNEESFVKMYLDDCVIATTPAASIFNSLQIHFPKIVHCPNGVDDLFFSSLSRPKFERRPLQIGWVGNPDDDCKGLRDILIPASRDFHFRYTDGRMSRHQLSAFYSQIDVLAIASYAESQPLPLLESMASGCFPVTTNVGIVPELIANGVNGLIVDRNANAFRQAFLWCSDNLDALRNMRHRQQRFASMQSWDICAQRFGDLFEYVTNLDRSGDFSLDSKFGRVVERAKVQVQSDPITPSAAPCSLLRVFRLAQWCAAVLGERCERMWFGDRFSLGLRERMCKIMKSYIRGVSSVIERFGRLFCS